jgi:hypothetical protein
MRSESGQATVEQVGIVLAVALLVGALAGALASADAGAAVARSLASAVGGALDGLLGGRVQHDAPALDDPTAAELGELALAQDPMVEEGQRPTLRDVRLRMEARLGVERGDVLFRRLLGEPALQLLPAISQPTRYIGYNSVPAPGYASRAPPPGSAGDTETPTGPATFHVITARDARETLDQRLNPRLDPVVTGVKLALGFLPGWWGEAVGGLEALDEITSAVRRQDGLPPLAREGDVLVCWPVLRRKPRVDDASTDFMRQSVLPPARSLYHLAVVRDGAVISQSAVPVNHPSPTPGGSSCHLS